MRRYKHHILYLRLREFFFPGAQLSGVFLWKEQRPPAFGWYILGIIRTTCNHQSNHVAEIQYSDQVGLCLFFSFFDALEGRLFI
jgi:hypothetical protein